MRIPLSIGITDNPRTWPVIEQRVKPDGIDLVPTVLHPSELFWRQLRFSEFDVSEMSISSLMIARSKGDDRFVGIPIFTTRLFFHTSILVRKDAKIDKPADLKGKRVGVPEYQQTAAVWVRGVLENEFGVKPSDMEFWMERNPAKSHGGATGFKAPAGRDGQPDPGGQEHRLDDGVGRTRRRDVLSARSEPDRPQHGRPAQPSRHQAAVPRPAGRGRPLLPKDRLYPINHGMVIKREIAEQHPWAITNILKAFNQANEIANASAWRTRTTTSKRVCCRRKAARRCARRWSRMAWRRTVGAGNNREVLASRG